MSVIQLSILCLSAVSIGLQLWKGRTAERIAATAFLVAMLATPLVDGFQVDGLRWGVGLLAILLFGTLVWLGLTTERWWLLAAAQGVTVVLEQLNEGECNYITRIGEGARIVRAVDHPNVRYGLINRASR